MSGRTTPRKRDRSTMANVDRVAANGERFRDAVLVRISLDRDNETSTETQEDECRAFSAMHNGNVVLVETERGQSAYKRGMHRAGLERVLRALEQGECNRLVVWKLDRLMRDTHDFSKVLNRMRDAGVHLVSRTEPWLDTTSPMGYAIAHIVAAVAEIESLNKSDRMHAFHDGRFKGADGEPLVPTAAAPFGYDRPSPNVLVINKAEQTVLMEMASRIARGESLRSICKDLNARGITTKGGATWNHSALKRAVTTPTVIAHAERHGALVPSSQWDAAMPVELWNVVGEILNDEARDINRGALKGSPMVVRHTLSGVIKCGADGCVGVLRPFGAQGRLKCSADGCKLSVQETATEDFVTACLFSMVTEDDWQNLRARGRTAERQAMDRLNNKREFARKQWMADLISDEDWLQVQTDIRELGASLAESDALDLPQWESLAEGWATASPEDKRTIINTVFESITAVPRAAGCNGTERIKLVPRDELALANAA